MSTETKIIKTLKLPNDTADSYQFNAVALEGLTRDEITLQFAELAEKIANKSDKGDADANYVSFAAISNVDVAGKTTTVYKHLFNTVPNVVVPTTETQTVTPSETTQHVYAREADYLSSVTVEPIPDQYVVPTGTIDVTTPGPHPVSGYENVNVNIPEFDGNIDVTEIN